MSERGSFVRHTTQLLQLWDNIFLGQSVNSSVDIERTWRDAGVIIVATEKKRKLLPIFEVVTIPKVLPRLNVWIRVLPCV